MLKSIFFKATLGAEALALIFAAMAITLPDTAEARKRPAATKQKKPQSQQPRRTQAFVYMNAETGDILDQKNADTPIEPASLAKEVTAMVVFDALRAKTLSLRTMLPLATGPGNGAVTIHGRTGLRPGTLLSVDEYLAATAVASAADATITLAIGVCGNESCFEDLMNRKADEILKPSGPRTTVFTNSHGMPGNRTTALDLARIHHYMIKTYPKESRYFSRTSYTVKGITHPGHNALLAGYKCNNSLGLAYRCMEASKTGYFYAAGSGIVGSAAWNGYRVIGVEMGFPSAGARNRALAAGLTRSFQALEQAGAPKTASQPWHLPAIGPKPHVEPEEDAEGMQDVAEPAPPFPRP